MGNESSIEELLDEAVEEMSKRTDEQDLEQALEEADVDANEIARELEEELENDTPERPKLFGYEWSFTCECGQTVGLSGMSTHPVLSSPEAYSESDVLTERIRTIEGSRTFNCPNVDCNRELKIGIEVVNNE